MSTLRLSSWSPRRGTLISWVLFVASFPSWNLHYPVWIALVPWLVSVSRAKSAKDAFKQGLLLSGLIGIGGFYWVGYVLHEFGAIPWPICGLFLVLFSWICQPQLLVMAPAYYLAMQAQKKRGPWAVCGILILLSFFYVGIDSMLPKLFQDTLGHSFFDCTWLRQVADLGGVRILSFVVIFVNFTLAECFKRTKPRDLKPLIPSAALAALMVAFCVVYGATKDFIVREWMSHPESAVRVALIQANIGDFDKIAAERGLHGASEKVLDTYFSLSDQALALQNRPDVIVWPETAYPSTFRKPFTADDFTHDKRVTDYSQSRKISLLFGGYDRDRGKDYNALFALAPYPLPSSMISPFHGTGNDLEFYRKNILLMFGEYVPYQDDIPGFNEHFPQIGNFGRGIGPDVLSVPIGSKENPRAFRVNPLICYEVLYPDYVIDGANQGSQAILNITNDSWFGPYGEPLLHLALSTFRSIETRLPLVRATNTGYSVLVQPDGTISDKTSLFKTEILNVSVPILNPMPTLAKHWGCWFEKVARLITLIFVGVYWIRRSRKARPLRQLSKT